MPVYFVPDRLSSYLLEVILTGIGLAANAADIRGYIKEKLDEDVQLEDVLKATTDRRKAPYFARGPNLRSLRMTTTWYGFQVESV